jgi:perosamine synthetase
VSNKVQHNKPLVTDQDREAVDAVLSSGWLASGPEVKGLESDFVDYFGSEGKACAVSSGTAALFLALKGLGVEPGGKVAVPTYACSALLNAVSMLGGIPIPVDVRRDNYTIDPDAVARLHAHAPFAAVIAVHTYGAAANIEDLVALGIPVIEDCCQSVGGEIAGVPLGIAGSAAVFSFYATKIITCGHGGLIFDRTGAIAEAAHDYKDFDGRVTHVPRFNFHLTDMQAAMARNQFRRIAYIRDRRRQISDRYRSALPKGLCLQHGFSGEGTLQYRFVVETSDSKQRDSLRQIFSNNGVDCIIPVERFELLHRYLQLDPDNFPVAEKIVECSLSLPLYPALKDVEVERVCEVLASSETSEI